MYTLTLKTIAVSLAAGLAVAAGVHAQMGQGNCMAGTGGMMHCGMDMSPASPQPLASSTSHALKITATMASPAKVGDNALDIGLTTAAGKPVTAAKVTAQVAMTSMDMGTASPLVRTAGKGHYATTAAFSMAGPWRVSLTVTTPGQKPQTRGFDFTAN